MSEPAQTTDDKRGVLDWLSQLFSDEPETRSELMDVLVDAAERRIMDTDTLNIIHGAIAVSDMQARDIMIPRSNLVFVCEDTPLEELLNVVITSKHSRFPVVGDDLDDLKGILHAKDLLPLLLQAREDRRVDLKDFVRQATVIPESKRLNVLLQEFRATRNHMALVVDEYGHVSGAVTIEDVLEQIVGEIEDEHDVHDDGFIKAMKDGRYNVKATTTIEDFNEYFSGEFADDEFDTIGGLVLKAFGRLPKRGETVEVAAFRFKVLNADSRRLRLLSVRKID